MARRADQTSLSILNTTRLVLIRGSIKVKSTKEVAKWAEKIQFHPLQKISHGRNGLLVMELRWRGHRELKLGIDAT